MTQSTELPAAAAALTAAVPGVAVVRLIPVYTEDNGGTGRRTHVSLWDGEGVELDATREACTAALNAVRAAFPGTVSLSQPYEYDVASGRLVPAAGLRMPPELEGPTAAPVTVRTLGEALDDDAGRIVAYRAGGSFLYCVGCGPHIGGVRLTADDLPHGGICCACGVDVLIADDAAGGAE